MKLIGFNFTKIYIEKLSNVVNNAKANNNIDIVSLEKSTQDVFKLEEEIFTIKFKYLVNFDPEFAKIEFEGNIALAVESKVSKEVLEMWEDKKLPDEFRLNLFNAILRKSNLKALELEDELGIPLHIPFPRLGKPEEKEK